MKVGFTGTRYGMSEPQKSSFDEWICSQPDIAEFHHGDCIGADDEAANILYEIHHGEDPGPPIKVVCHPPVDDRHQAFNLCYDEMRQAKTHFARNRDIVDETDVLVACPLQMEHQSRGGTWYTVDYARKRCKRVVIIWRDGTIEDSADSRAEGDE